MDGIFERYCDRTQKQGKSFDKKILALVMSFAVLPVFGETNAKIPDNYTGNYQSYFQDEFVPQQHHSLIREGGKDSTIHSLSSSDKKGKTTAHKSSSPPIGLATQADEAITRPPKRDSTEDHSKDVSLLRLRQSDPPVHWNNIGRHVESGGLHGNIGSQIEIDDVRWRDTNRNSGKFKLATIQAFLRHDELPNWYFGFWNAREDDYKGQFSNQEYTGTNTINEFFVGHIFETWRGNIGTEVMVGSETTTRRWKSRFKLWQDIRVSSKWSFAGYTYLEYQPRSNQPGNGDLQQYIFETEPAIQYRVTPDLGLYLRPYYYYNRQKRKKWGDIVEQEWKMRAGFWRNWYPLLTSMYIGFGQDKIDNASHSREVFYDGHYQFIGGTISYPIFDKVRLYGEFKASFTKQAGLWTKTGHSWNPFTVLGVKYSF